MTVKPMPNVIGEGDF